MEQTGDFHFLDLNFITFQCLTFTGIVVNIVYCALYSIF